MLASTKQVVDVRDWYHVCQKSHVASLTCQPASADRGLMMMTIIIIIIICCNLRHGNQECLYSTANKSGIGPTIQEVKVRNRGPLQLF